MSRQTPRKGRHQHNPSTGGGGGGGGGGHRRQPSQQQHVSLTDSNASAFDNISDAQAPGSGDDPSLQVHRGTESLTDMNLHVLRRYEPTIRSILATAASTVVYVLNYETGGWEKPEPQVEGTLFLCEQEPLVVQPYELPRACVFVLNRKGLMNVVVDLAKVNVAEVTADLITLRIEEGAGSGVDANPEGGNGEREQQQQQQHPSSAQTTNPVLGFWIHGGSGSGAQQFNPNLVVECWQNIRTSLEQTLGTAELAQTASFLDAAAMVAKMEIATHGGDPDGIATTAIGPQPGIKELVAMALGPSTGGGGPQAGVGVAGT